MATKKKDEATVEGTASKETAKKQVTVKTGNEKVKVRVLKNVDCTIHNKQYKFKAGEDEMVDAGVAAILVNSGKATKI